jgi:hypothetical protein
MSYSKEQLLVAIDYIYRQKRSFSVKVMAENAGVPVDLMKAVVETLPQISCAALDCTPAGRIKNFKMTYCAEGFVFLTIRRVWCNGVVTESSGKGWFSNSKYAEHLQTYRDRAANEGLRFYEDLKLEVIAQEVFFRLYPDQVPKIEVVVVEHEFPHLIDFPDTLARVQDLSGIVVALEQKIAHLEATDKANKETYEREYREAESGRRVKKVPYLVQTGTERQFSHTRVETCDFWGQAGQSEDVYSNNPVYETRDRTERDYPKEPDYHREEIRSLNDDLISARREFRWLNDSPSGYQKDATERRKQEQLRSDYQKEQRELDAKYKKMGMI